jgi:hypothetical protein
MGSKVMTTNEGIQALLDRVGDLRPAYEEHLADNVELLPHVFMGDVTRCVVSLHKRGLREHRPEHETEILFTILQLTERALREGDDDLQGLIVVSFLENLDQSDEDYESLKALLGEELTRHLSALEADV